MTLALFIVCLILAGVSYYFGYRPPKQSVPKWRTRGGFYAFAVLSILLAVVLWHESRAADGLARYIAPYPAINGVTWIPPVPGNSSRHWMFTTADQPVVVARYYTDPNHHPGWTVEEMAGSFLVLKKRNQLPANRDRPRFEHAEQGKTTIIYTLENKCK